MSGKPGSGIGPQIKVGAQSVGSKSALMGISSGLLPLQRQINGRTNNLRTSFCSSFAGVLRSRVSLGMVCSGLCCFLCHGFHLRLPPRSLAFWLSRRHLVRSRSKALVAEAFRQRLESPILLVSIIHQDASANCLLTIFADKLRD